MNDEDNPATSVPSGIKPEDIDDILERYNKLFNAKFDTFVNSGIISGSHHTTPSYATTGGYGVSGREIEILRATQRFMDRHNIHTPEHLDLLFTNLEQLVDKLVEKAIEGR